jgi:HicA toxin of bacterial toxin-antitoxin,
MGRLHKLLLAVLSGQSDQNIAFSELLLLLNRLGFEMRVKGSHHIFWKPGVEEILNLQAKGANAKAYQVKQVREIIVKYRMMPSEANDE